MCKLIRSSFACHFGRGAHSSVLPETMDLVSRMLTILLCLGILLPTFCQAVLCKCTGPWCESDVCNGQYCIAILLESSNIRGPDASFHIRGCASTNLQLDLMKYCFDYNSTETRSERRQVCLFPGTMRNDGPLPPSANRHQFGECPSSVGRRRVCEAEYCYRVGHEMDNGRNFTGCLNRVVPLLNEILDGVVLRPALILGTLPKWLNADNSSSAVWSNRSVGEPRLTDVRAQQTCPQFVSDYNNETLGECRGERCLQLDFNLTNYRGTTVRRSYSGCVSGATDDWLRKFNADGNCAYFYSPIFNVLACVSDPVSAGSSSSVKRSVFVVVVLVAILTKFGVLRLTS